MRALVKEPGKTAVIRDIENELKELQRIVGGYIETVTLTSDAVVICNEEGRLSGLPYNCEICGVDFVGTIALVGVKGDEFTDLSWTKEEIEDAGLELERMGTEARAPKEKKRRALRELTEDEKAKSGEEIRVVLSEAIERLLRIADGYNADRNELIEKAELTFLIGNLATDFEKYEYE